MILKRLSMAIAIAVVFLGTAAALTYAQRLDLIVANDVSAPGVGFGHDTNAVTILGADGFRRDVGLADKRAVATALLDSVSAIRARARSSSPGPLDQAGRSLTS